MVQPFPLRTRRRPRSPKAQPLRPPVEILSAIGAQLAMTGRHVDSVFRILNRHGYSQRAIARLTGQSQSEISEILAGRQVLSVDLIERIADALGTPRGWWRLASGNSDDEEIRRVLVRQQQAELERDNERSRRAEASRVAGELRAVAGVITALLTELNAVLAANQTATGNE